MLNGLHMLEPTLYFTISLALEIQKRTHSTEYTVYNDKFGNEGVSAIHLVHLNKVKLKVAVHIRTENSKCCFTSGMLD